MTTKKSKNAETQSILDCFANLPDPRRDNENRRHELIDIIAIAILVTICGAERALIVVSATGLALAMGLKIAPPKILRINCLESHTK